MNVDTHEVWREERSIELTATEFNLLAVPARERPPRDLQVRDPRQRVGLRLPRRPQHRRDLHQLPAQEDRRPRAAAHPHHPARRLHPPAAPRADEPPQAARRRRGAAAGHRARWSPTSSPTPRSAPSSTVGPTRTLAQNRVRWLQLPELRRRPPRAGDTRRICRAGSRPTSTSWSLEPPGPGRSCSRPSGSATDPTRRQRCRQRIPVQQVPESTAHQPACRALRRDVPPRPRRRRPRRPGRPRRPVPQRSP